MFVRYLLTICLTLGAVVVKIPVQASSIVLLEENFSYQILLNDAAELRRLLESELKSQRQNNRELQQFTKPGKVARVESRLLTQRLQAEGYYDASVRFSILDDIIEYRISQGRLYTIRKIELKLPEQVDVPLPALGIKEGDPLRAQAVLSAQNNLNNYLRKNYCLWQIDTDYEAIAETQTHSALLRFTVTDSPPVRFGELSFSGLQSIDEDYLRDRITFSKGECFKRSTIDKARLHLVNTNLLASVNAQFSEPQTDEVPINFQVVERRHRTFSLGGGYQTDEGFALSLRWEHRNLMGRAQRFRINSYVADNYQSLNTDLTFPHFRRNNQNLTLYSDLESEDTDAFVSELVDVGIELSRPLRHYFRATIGADLSFSNVLEDDSKERFTFLSLPLSLEYDRRSDPLDPRAGWVANVRFRPYQEIDTSNTSFAKSSVAGSIYYSLDKTAWRPTFALRGALGWIDGAQMNDVPANVRFYVGGGGSVRGYPFQSLGPLDSSDPEGGMSFSELSIETRLRWGKDWGGVWFVDGGFAYEESAPQIGGDLRWGTGIGIRYFTSFAPIRFDIAVPLNKRDGIDDDFQLYISIGQSF